jgi:hypothetical protein
MPAGARDERSEHHRPHGGEHVEAFEQLAAPEFGGPVMEPDPEPVFDPLRIRLRPRRRGPSQGGVEGAVTLPQDQPVLDPLVELAVGDEFQVDMNGRGAIQRDEQARLADMLASEAGQQRSQAGREGGGTGEQIRLVLIAAYHDEVQVREFVHCAGDGRPAGREANDSRIILDGRDHGLCVWLDVPRRPVGDGHDVTLTHIGQASPRRRPRACEEIAARRCRE